MKKILACLVLLSFSSPVMAQVATEEQARQMIHVEKTPILLSSHLKKRYQGYKVTVSSEYPSDLELTQGAIDNGVPGSVAADSTSTSYVNMLWGLPLWLLGLGIAAAVISGKNKKAETEAYPFPNQVQSTTLHKGDSLNFNALVPVGQSPALKLKFMDSKNNLSFSKVG